MRSTCGKSFGCSEIFSEYFDLRTLLLYLHFIEVTNPFIIYFCSVFTHFFSRSFAKVVGCEMASLKACAKKRTFQELLFAQLEVFNFPNFLPFAPVVDGYFMPGLCYFTINVTFCTFKEDLLNILSDLRLRGLWWIKETEKTTLNMDSLRFFGLPITSFDSPWSVWFSIVNLGLIRLIRII